jgi:hypothetical protein
MTTKKQPGIKNEVCKKPEGFPFKTLGPYKTTRRRKDPSLKVRTLTPYYVRAIKDHQKEKRSQPQGTYVLALLRTRHT